MLQTIAIIGTGMIGGSIGLAIRAKLPACTVIGYDLHAPSLQQALDLGICTSTAVDLPSAVSQADLVIFASPVHRIGAQLLEALPCARPGTIFTDVGSTKQEICAITRQAFAASKVHYVPGHPIAGSEKNGPLAARGDLFEGKLTILCPLDGTPAQPVKAVTGFWKNLGARVEILNPAEHDRIFGLTSHLPHLIAYALAGCLDSKHAPFTGGGFRDTTRVALSDPNLWTEIFRSNREPLLNALGSFRLRLNEIETALKCCQDERVRELLSESQQARKQVQ